MYGTPHIILLLSTSRVHRKFLPGSRTSIRMTATRSYWYSVTQIRAVSRVRSGQDQNQQFPWKEKGCRKSYYLCQSLYHADRAVTLWRYLAENQGKKTNSSVIEQTTGIQNYDAHEELIKELCRKITRTNYPEMKRRAEAINNPDTISGSTNICTFLDRFEAADDRWIAEIRRHSAQMSRI